MPSPTVSKRKTCGIRHVRSESFNLTIFHLPLFGVYYFQFREAGGAPRGWITLCTVPTFWPPSPPWLFLTFSTPPTGSPPTWQLLFSARWALPLHVNPPKCSDSNTSSCEWPRTVRKTEKLSFNTAHAFILLSHKYPTSQRSSWGEVWCYIILTAYKGHERHPRTKQTVMWRGATKVVVEQLAVGPGGQRV